MRYWWVNQNQTYQHEVGGGYLWSPKTNTNGRRNLFYDSMTEASPGDVVFSFCDTYIKALGVVNGYSKSAPKPTEFGSAGQNWANEGWYLSVRFIELDRPIRPKDHMDSLAVTLPKKYSPLQVNGNGNQGVYLAPVPEVMAIELSRLLNGQVDSILAGSTVDDDTESDSEENNIRESVTIPETERKQLIKARVGQGVFRSRVESLEKICRVSGVIDGRFLRASHIKPWAKSDNREKLDGNNGLMLAPHADHLFDKGFITFTDEGALVFSKSLPQSIKDTWFLDRTRTAKPLTDQQIMYMTYHRMYIFKG